MNNLSACSSSYFNSSATNNNSLFNQTVYLPSSSLAPGFIPNETWYSLLVLAEPIKEQRFREEAPVNGAIAEDCSFFSRISKLASNLLGFPDWYLDTDEPHPETETQKIGLPGEEPSEEECCALDEEQDIPLKATNRLNILMGSDHRKPIARLCSLEAVSCFKGLTSSKEPRARDHIHNSEISLISVDGTFRREFIQSLPFTPARIISAHGTLENIDHDFVHHVHFLKDKKSSSRSKDWLPTKDILPLFKSKQDFLFLISCYGTASHFGLDDDALGNSYLITFSHPGVPLNTEIATEIESYIVESIKLDKNPLDIIVNIAIRFPSLISIKAPNKPTAHFNEYMFQDWKANPELKPTLKKVLKYLELKHPELSPDEVEEHLKRRNELKLFDCFTNNQIIDDDTREAILEKIEDADAACINRLKLRDGSSLIHNIILSIHDLEEKISIPAAIREFFHTILNHCIKVGADLNPIDEYGNTPLHLAIPLKDTVWATKLITAGANLNIVGQNGTPLHVDLIESKNPVLASRLIHSGADVNLRKKDGITPLLIALKEHKNSRIIDEILAAGADVNAKTPAGLTAMHLVVKQSIARVRQFIELGADLNVIYRSLGTPLDLAEDPKIIQLLRDAGALTAKELVDKHR